MPAAFLVPTSLGLLDDITCNGTTVVDWPNLPQGYKHLFVVWNCNTQSGAGADVLMLAFNADRTASYGYAGYFGGSVAVGPFSAAAQGQGRFGVAPGVPGGATFVWASGQLWLPDYSSALHRQSWLSTSWRNDGGGFGMEMVGGDKLTIAAVSRLQLFAASGAQLTNGSRFTLYGVR